jgi:tetrahydromethanopterin S-methyltransferase subunit F
MFFTPLRAEKVHDAGGNGRAKWRLLESLRYRSHLLGRVIEVPAGYETDFASVPRLPLAYMLAGDTGHAAAVIHDFLVDTMVEDAATWDRAAEVFREALRHEGLPGWRIGMMTAGVRMGCPYPRNEGAQT